MRGAALSRRQWIAALFAAGLAVRLAVALVSPGTGDSANFIVSGRTTQAGQNVFVAFNTYNYPPPYLYILAATFELADAVGMRDTLAVKLPASLADSLIAVFVYLIAARVRPDSELVLGWLYALNPITILISAHHGHFDSLAALPAVAAMWLWIPPGRVWRSSLALGLAGALKIVPAFVGLAWMPDLRHWRQLIVFAVCVAAPVAAALGAGWLMAPVEFTADVLRHRSTIEGGWGYNFPLLLAEWAARRMDWQWVVAVGQHIRGAHQFVLIGALILTAFFVRQRPFIERVVILQLALQVFAGRWAVEYTAWVMPAYVLSNQRGLAAWGLMSAIWSGAVYGLLLAPEAWHDNINRGITLLGGPYWLVTAAWFCANAWPGKFRMLSWMTVPLAKVSQARPPETQVPNG